MAVAIEQFVQGLEQSGLISPSDLRAIRGKLPLDRQDNAQELAHELVRQKILTTYQVKEAYQGNAKNLVLGNYTILDQIGQGGMGQVFKAQHRKMKRLVAIKLLPAAMTKDQAAINRFQREVEAAAKLEHPNIVTAHDADESAGRHFLVMQYVEGTDLSALVKKNGPLPVADAINYVLQSARGLEFAHGEGVVHRDIKPANLLLDKKGIVKILDMGLARFESTAGAEHAELTGTGQIMGTVDYMSPEQALDTKHANERSDIYSLGCTLWYLVTGRAAFGGESVMAKLLAHREQPIPSLEAACPGATPALETLFKKMLAKKEEDRYQSMSAVVTDLERICSGQVAAAQPAARNTGPVGDDQAEDHHCSEFLGGTNPSKAASRRATSKPVAVEKRPASPVLEATITMAGPQIETDPKTEQSLVVPAARSTGWKNWRKRAGRRRLQMACAAGAAALLLSGIVVFLKLKPETVQPLPRTAQGVRPRLLPAIAPFDAKQALAYQEAWAKHLGAEVEIENSLGMKLRLIPPGEFTMGSTPAEIEEALKFTGEDKHWQECIKSEAPQHKVILTQPFYLGTHEVTQAEYEKVMEKNPSHFAPMGAGKDAVAEMDTTTHPVEQVSWNDAAEFCAKLSEKEKLKPFYFRSGETVTMLAGTGYRLASEAEWEFACRAGTTTKYWIGDQDEDLPQAAWFSTNSGNRTHQVGELKVNPFGLYDIHGNVWEWVQDEWEPPYYRQFQDHPALNPSGPSPAGSRRVIRGGGWHADASRCRASSRRAVPLLLVGFRVSMAIEPQTPRGNAAKVSSSVSRDRPHIQTTTSDERAGKQADVPAPAIAPFDAKQALAHQEAWAWHLGTKVEIENSLGMKLRLIPPGEFMMGSPQDEIDELVQSTTEPEWQRWFRSEGPRHRAKLTQAFYLGSCEVTQGQYEELMAFNPSHFSATGPAKDIIKNLDTAQHPVESVSWFDAIDFCNKLSEQERRSPYYVRYGEVVKIVGGTGYRLPTEAEWECACRAGTTTRWSFGDTERDLGQHAWTPSNSNGRTQRVGELRANPFGLYDLYGNVFEWCWDWHGEYGATAVSDPTGATAGSGRVLRGGAFDSHLASHCRSASRRVYEPVSRFYVGFRVCCGR